MFGSYKCARFAPFRVSPFVLYIYFVRFSRDCGAFIGTLYTQDSGWYIYNTHITLKKKHAKRRKYFTRFFFHSIWTCASASRRFYDTPVCTRVGTSQTCCSPLAAPHCSEEAQWGRWYGKDCKASIYLQKNRAVVAQRHLLCGGSRTLSTVSFWRKPTNCAIKTVANFILVWTVAEMKYLNFEDAKQFMKRYNFIISGNSCVCEKV